MTREEAIKFWKFRYENTKDYTDPHWEAQERREHREYVEALRMAIDALQTEAVQGWIPCSERLPDAEYGEGDSMLCCTESGLMYILYWNGGNWCASTGEPYHWVNHKTGWHDKVIAWMPRSC